MQLYLFSYQKGAENFAFRTERVALSYASRGVLAVSL
jgi:hypothetical protein